MGSGDWLQQNSARASICYTCCQHCTFTLPPAAAAAGISNERNNNPTTSDLIKREKNSHG